MSDTRYSVRDHDAEWLLQRERLHSDGILQKQRRSQKPKKRSTNIAAPRRLTPSPPRSGEPRPSGSATPPPSSERRPPSCSRCSTCSASAEPT
ncbi:hypothetical protein ACNF49_13980 [Actinomadura sp. ATCC 39365]